MRQKWFALLSLALCTTLSAADVIKNDGPAAIKGSYAIFFDDNARSSNEAAFAVNGIAARGFLKVDNRWSKLANGMAVSGVDDATAAELAKTPGIKYVVQDFAVKPSATQTSAPQHLDRIDQAQLPFSGTYTYQHTGAGVHAYIIDGGIRTTHQDFITGGVSRASNDVDYHTGSAGTYTGTGAWHGTGVASVLGGNTYGVAKGVRLHGVVIASDVGDSSAAKILSGLEWVALHGLHPGVVNISWNLVYKASDPTLVSLRNAVNTLASNGFFVSVSAGNDGRDSCIDAMAGASGAYTVGGIVSSDSGGDHFWNGFLDSSGRGPCVSALAVGGAQAASYQSNTLTDWFPGTSFSAPVASGIAALLWQKSPSFTRAQVVSTINAQVTYNVVLDVPAGTPNYLLHVWSGL